MLSVSMQFSTYLLKPTFSVVVTSLLMLVNTCLLQDYRCRRWSSRVVSQQHISTQQAISYHNNVNSNL